MKNRVNKMNKMQNELNKPLYLFFILLISFSWNCLETTSQGSDDPGDTADPSDSDLEQEQRVSECGGFANNDVGSASYCDADLLTWSYTEETGTLSFTDTLVTLNCCGDHSIGMALIDGVYVVTETDAPQTSEEGDILGRCNCICVFDFNLTVSGIPAETIDIRLERFITDEMDGPSVIWEGELDLSKGVGSEVLVEAYGECADEPVDEPVLSQTQEVSECGGFTDDDSSSYSFDSYCDAEILAWHYDEANNSLAIRDKRVGLNCCGERSIAAELVDGVYEVTVTDTPGDSGGRCFCTCIFDFALTIEEVPLGDIQVRLIRDVTDDPSGPLTIWDGELALSGGSGSVIVDDSVVDIGICGQ